MCRPTTCKVCGKTTWAGCGEHVAQVKAAVPAADWCGGDHTPAEEAAAKTGRGSFFGKLLRR